MCVGRRPISEGGHPKEVNVRVCVRDESWPMKKEEHGHCFFCFLLGINMGFEVERLGCGNGVCVFGLECVCLGCWTFGCLELK